MVACFCESVAADGFMRRYLNAGQLAVVIDCNVFVHGGLYNVDAVSLVDFYPVGIPSLRDATVGPSLADLLQWLTGYPPPPPRTPPPSNTCSRPERMDPQRVRRQRVQRGVWVLVRKRFSYSHAGAYAGQIKRVNFRELNRKN